MPKAFPKWNSEAAPKSEVESYSADSPTKDTFPHVSKVRRRFGKTSKVESPEEAKATLQAHRKILVIES